MLSTYQHLLSIDKRPLINQNADNLLNLHTANAYYLGHLNVIKLICIDRLIDFGRSGNCVAV